jgi:hypothetical protein
MPKRSSGTERVYMQRMYGVKVTRLTPGELQAQAVVRLQERTAVSKGRSRGCKASKGRTKMKLDTSFSNVRRSSRETEPSPRF